MIVFLSIGWAGCLAPFSVAQQRASLPQVPRAVKEGTAQLVGHADSAQMVRLVFALRPPHLEEEEQFLNQLQDRESPLFHKYLSEQEWNQRFAPSAEDEKAVVAWAQSQGLTITQRYPNRLLVDVEAPVAVIEKALDVAINRYQMGSASYYSNDRYPAIPAQLVGVLYTVLGLNNLEVMHTFSKGSRDFTGPDYSAGPAYAVGSHLTEDSKANALHTVAGKKKIPSPDNSFYYFPNMIAGTGGYDYAALQKLGHCCNPLNNPGNSPPEASIAIAIWGDFSDTDLGWFIQISYSGLAQNVQRYSIDGTPPCCNPETTLDVEYTTAMGNSFSSSANTAEIHVYEGVNNHYSTILDVLNRILTDGHARVLSMSWGDGEAVVGGPTMDSYHAVFNQLIGQGWTLVASSGDGGATADCANNLSVIYPATDPDVTAAGGTTLEISGYYQYEYGWSGGNFGCADNDGGSGGGCSSYYMAPGYQSSPACGPGSRSVPDLALNADWVNTGQVFGYQLSYEPGGGTSIVAPELAGFYAQANAYLLYIGSIVGNTCGPSNSAPCAPLGNANWYLYYEGYQPFAPHYPFYDITSGCNNNDITQQYGLTPFCAGPGYDMVTGWGSANMLQLSWMMNAFVAGDSGAPVATFSGPQPSHWYTTDQPIGWTIIDTSASGHLPNGVAGFDYHWDADPGDPYSEPTPSDQTWDSSNSFYSGPAYPNDSHGLSFLSTMPNGQGCHTVLVRAWDNAGLASMNSDGPLCYDPYPPGTAIGLSGYQEGQYYAGPVLVTLYASDWVGSGVASTQYQINGGNWQNYTEPIYVTVPGAYIVAFYSTDVAGNVENTEYASFTIAYNSQYLVSVSPTGTGHGSVSSADGYIHCGTTCSYNYYDGTPVTLTATPAAGSVFAGWSGCDLSFGPSCTLSVTDTRSVTAIFNIPVALQFVPVPPCRLVDTRMLGYPIQGGTWQDFAVPQEGGCNIPATAAAYSLNVTVVPPASLGFLTMWSSGLTRPSASTMNSYDGRVKATGAIVPAGNNGAVSVYASDTTDVILDIDGYFVPATGSSLAFYPLTPCRVVDTRQAGGNGPILSGTSQDFPVLHLPNCIVPSTAQAYSFNVTAVPSGPLYVLKAWPTGGAVPGISTLNDYTGTVVANAAIVGAGTNGEVSVYASNDTDVVIDIDGYFAPPGAGGLSFYTMPPCRVIDTRRSGPPFSGTLVPPVDVQHSICAPAATARAYAFNATVVPQGALGYLTLWPNNEPKPRASTLNAWDAMVTSNMAIVPTIDGAINAAASDLTQLILDISGYFAP